MRDTPGSLRSLVDRLVQGGHHQMAATISGASAALEDLGLAKGDTVVVETGGGGIGADGVTVVEGSDLQGEERPGFDDLAKMENSGAELVAKGCGEGGESATEDGDEGKEDDESGMVKGAADDAAPALHEVPIEASALVKGLVDVESRLAASQEEAAILKGEVQELRTIVARGEETQRAMLATLQAMQAEHRTLADGAAKRDAAMAAAMQGIIKGVGETYLLDRTRMTGEGESAFPSGKGRTGRFDVDVQPSFADNTLVQGVTKGFLTDSEMSSYRGTNGGQRGRFSTDPARHEAIVAKLQTLNM
jgi:hypothetical protein